MSRSSLEDQHIAVIGGGLGGLCAALCFRRLGAEVVVFEAAANFGEVGAGIQLSSNGLRVLRALGLDPGSELLSKGLTLNDHFGRRVAILPNGPRREVRLFHRADLMALLEHGVRQAGVEIRLGEEVSPENVPQADLVIAADGVRSKFRAMVSPETAKPEFTGQSAWRALVEPPKPIIEAGVNVYMGPGRHVVLYPVRGGRLLNLVAGEDTAEELAEGWRQGVPREALQERFADFAGPIPELLQRVTKVHRWGLYNHSLPRRWSNGNVVLLGDAAHAMLPYLAQGACAAFEDAYALSRAWANFKDVDEALGEYEKTRAPRVSRVMKEARANATRFHHSNTVARIFGHAALRAASRIAPGAIARRFDWLYDFDPTA